MKNTIPNNNLYYFLSPDYFFMDKKDTIPQYNIHPKSSKPLYSMFLFYSKGSLDTDLKKNIYIEYMLGTCSSGPHVYVFLKPNKQAFNQEYVLLLFYPEASSEKPQRARWNNTLNI